ncbi:hypothetical protein Gohar_002367, partial [Gossypium harknessii]|nr:hypothetical protein [Gossypium harknessii]
MEALHKLNLQGKNDKNWQDYYKEYIDIWDCGMRFLPIREPFFLLDMTTCLEYLPWFKVADKLYLLSMEAKKAPYCAPLQHPAFTPIE